MPARTDTQSRPLSDDRLWDAADVAGYLTVSRSMVYKLEQAGELPCVRIGARVRFEPGTVRAFARGELRGLPDGRVVRLDPAGPR